MRFATLFIVIRLSSPFQGTIHLKKDGKSVAFLPQKVNGESAKLMKDQGFRSAVLDLETAALDSP